MPFIKISHYLFIFFTTQTADLDANTAIVTANESTVCVSEEQADLTRPRSAFTRVRNVPPQTFFSEHQTSCFIPLINNIRLLVSSKESLLVLLY